LIAEIIPEAYDVEGRKVFRPDYRRHGGFKPTFPTGRFLSQPLQHWCSDLEDLRRFLCKCKYVSDLKQFGKRDYWQPPEEFEQTKRGDCDDFALWTWRQLLHMGYSSRFVVGTAGRYGQGHAWVTLERDGKSYLVEPLVALLGSTRPRLSVLRYKPRFSVSWDGKNLSYYQHEPRSLKASPGMWVALIAERTVYSVRLWMTILARAVTVFGSRALGIKRSRTEGR